jgi:hypothetical protein
MQPVGSVEGFAGGTVIGGPVALEDGVTWRSLQWQPLR